MQKQQALPSPKVCFRSSCLASSLTMRLLPFKYSLYFWRNEEDQRRKKPSISSNCSVPPSEQRCVGTHGEVEAFRLLLIGSSLADVCLAHVGVGGGGFHRLGGLAVLESLGNVKVLHGEHVLKGLHGRVKRLPHLTHTHTLLTSGAGHFCHIAKITDPSVLMSPDHPFPQLPAPGKH